MTTEGELEGSGTSRHDADIAYAHEAEPEPVRHRDSWLPGASVAAQSRRCIKSSPTNPSVGWRKPSGIVARVSKPSER